jgi:uncharacterized Zn-binding protein involved in type VI secretion
MFIGGPGPHIGGPIVGPSGPLVISEAALAARLADFAACTGIPGLDTTTLDTITEGASMVLIHGLPAVRVGDGTIHGGKVGGPGAPTIEIGGPTFAVPRNFNILGTPSFTNKVVRDLYFLSTTPSGRALLARLEATGQPVVIVYGEDDQEVGIPHGPQVIFYNPEDNGNVVGAGNAAISCPAQVALGHELVHAMNNAEGSLVLFGTDPSPPASQPGIAEREAQAIGAGSHSGDYPTENSLRKDLGLPRRDNHFGVPGDPLPPAGTLRPGDG